ncbi:MAG: ATP-binding cassette domain-containing protein [Ignavibacteria bacterium]|nr:ATP-binding cassette domain-containing protein [Ignavibacteria bacterium]
MNFFNCRPSGCGKTTLLRIIAGLEFADTGKIIIGGADSTDLPPQKEMSELFFRITLFSRI